MRRGSPNIRPESSALGMKKPTSPLLKELIRAVLELRREHSLSVPRLALEYGCGLLRNLRELRRHFSSVCVVDTETQLTRVHDFSGKRSTVQEYVQRFYRDGCVTVMNDYQFKASRLRPDVIFSINVMDVVPAETRLTMLDNVKKHLPSTGQFASLVPRNDSRTLNLCRGAQTYRDGHLFPNHGAFTYYRNWSADDLQRLYQSHGLQVMRDLSCYRYSCIVCELRLAKT
jgi:methyltransferase family protein